MSISEYCEHMETQSTSIANRYGLIPAYVNQDNILDRLSSYNNLGVINNISDILDDKGSSHISTMSILSHMNPYTPVRRLALIHSTGTGKTRKALLAALSYNRDITIVAVHNIQSKPFISEFLPGGVLPQIYPGFNKRLDVLTCRSIMTAVSKNDMQRLDYYFRDRVIIVDEVHHVRSKGDRKRSSIALFDTIVSVLSVYKDSVILLLTATPLVDNVSELVGLYTLLKGVSPRESNTNLLVHNLRGYISKLDRKNLPTHEENVKCIMVEDGEQWRLYQKHQNDRSSVHSRTSAISRFITNDDVDASECDMTTSAIIEYMLQGRMFQDHAEYTDAYLDALKSISIKYYMLIKNLRDNRGQPHFIFDIWKKRGGINRVFDILTMPMIGYTSVTTEQEALDRSKELKLLALHKVASKSNSGVASKLLDIYNSYENRDGSLIDVLLATPKFAESMSVRTAKYKHTLNCFWNVPGKHQVDGRINRRTSLWYEAPADRVIYGFNYVLYKPDGSETVESRINEQSEIKYSEIIPVLKIMDDIKLENYYSVDNEMKTIRLPIYPHNTRINNRIRMCTPVLNYRHLQMDVLSFLGMLEQHEDVYCLMRFISSSNEGYTRLISVAIQAIEHVYIDSVTGIVITDKQKKLLDDMSKAFVTNNGTMMHLLYFVNSDTVEYQRMNTMSRRVVRVLEGTVWVDNIDVQVVATMTNTYNAIVDNHVSNIYDLWYKYGYYVTKYILSSCYRLVEHRDKSTVMKGGLIHDVDNRKLSRGEKWNHYSKTTLIIILAKLNSYNRSQCILLYKKAKTSDIFTAVLSSMENKGMMLTLPI
jgi:hypothetical protein